MPRQKKTKQRYRLGVVLWDSQQKLPFGPWISLGFCHLAPECGDANAPKSHFRSSLPREGLLHLFLTCDFMHFYHILIFRNSQKQAGRMMSDQCGPSPATPHLGRTELLPPLPHFYPVSAFVLRALGCFCIILVYQLALGSCPTNI